jgi:hypothetical protein
MSKSEFSKFIPKGVINRTKFTNNENFLKEIKMSYLQQIKDRQGGEKLLEILAKSNQLNPKNFVDELADILTLSEVYYYLSYFFTATTSFEVACFSNYNKDSINDYSKESNKDPNNIDLFYEFGQPIWNAKLTEIPKLWNGFKENDNHIFLTYIHKGEEKYYFDPVTHNFEKYTLTAIINFRLHLEDSVVETFSKHSNEKSIRYSFNDVKSKFDLSGISFKEITDEDIRKFDSRVEQVTHEKREGDAASAAMTRANNKSDTRNDSLRDVLNQREFRKENGLINLDNGIQSVVGLTAGERGKIQIKSRLLPNDQIVMFHTVKNILGW